MANEGIELRAYSYSDPTQLVDIIPLRLAPQALEELDKVGVGKVTLPDSARNSAASEYRNYIKVLVDGVTRAGFIVQEKKPTLISKGEYAGKATVVSGEGPISWFNDAVVLPEGGLKNGSFDTRVFNFATARGPWYQASDWSPAVEIIKQGKSTHQWSEAPAEFPDNTNASWIWSVHHTTQAPAGYNYFRREFTTTASGSYKIFIAADDLFEAFIDGQKIIVGDDKDSSWRETRTVSFDLEAGNHVFGARVKNTGGLGGTTPGPAGLLMAMYQITETNGTAVQKLLFTTGTNNWSAATYGKTPGWTAGDMLIQLQSEAFTRGVAFAGFIGRTFTNAVDSNGVAWKRELSWEFKVGSDNYMTAIEKVQETGVSVWVDPDTLQLNAVQTRGTDKSTGTATVALYEGKHLTKATSDERADIKNNLYVRNQEGWNIQSDSTSVGKYGRIEGKMEFDLSNAESTKYTTEFLKLRAKPEESAEYELIAQPGATPWVDFSVGDWVRVVTSSGTIKRRVMSISATEEESSYVSYTVEFDTIFLSKEQELQKKIEQLTKDTSLGNLTTSSKVTTGTASQGGGKFIVNPLPVTNLSGEAIGYWSDTGRPFTEVQLTWTAPFTNDDGSVAEGLQYEVHGVREFGSPTTYAGRFFTTVDQTNTSLFNLNPREKWQFKVRTINLAGKTSPFVSLPYMTLPYPLQKLDPPTKPVLSSEFGLVIAKWDGKLTQGVNPVTPPNHLSTVVGFWSTSENGTYTRLGTGMPYAGDIVLPGLTRGSTVWVKLKAIDIIGNESPFSASASIKVDNAVQETIDSALEDVQNAIDDLQEEISTFDGNVTASPNEPTAADGANKPNDALWYRYSGNTLVGTWKWNKASNTWVLQKWGSGALSDQINADLQKAKDDAAKAVQDAGNALIDSSAANGKVTQSQSAPVSGASSPDVVGKPQGALWYRFNANNELIATYKLSGTTWTEQKTSASNLTTSLNTEIAKAQTALETATSADKRTTVATTAPTTANGSDKPTGALWYQYTGTELQGTWRWTGSAWVVVSIGAAAIANSAITTDKLASGIKTDIATGVAAQGAATTAQERADKAVQDALNANNLAEAKGKTIYQATAPTGSNAATANLWIRSSDNKPFTYNGTTWVASSDKVATDAADAAAKAQAYAASLLASAQNVILDPSFANGQWSATGWAVDTATGAGRTDNFSMRSNGTSSTSVLSLAQGVAVEPGQVWEISGWYRTSADWNGTSGNSKLRLADQSNGIRGPANAITAGSTEWTYTSGRYTIPASGLTSLRLALYADNTAGTVWWDDIALKDVTQAAAALKAAQDADLKAREANDLATSKGKAIIQSAAPAAADRLPQNLWIDTTGGANTPKRWNGTAWVEVTDKVAKDAADAAAKAILDAKAAQDTANAAADAAVLNGKQFTKSTAIPPTSSASYPDNSVWYQVDGNGDIIGMWTKSGNVWVKGVITNEVVGNLSAGKIVVGTMLGDRIEANTIRTDRLMIGDMEDLFEDRSLSYSGAWAGAAFSLIARGSPNQSANMMVINALSGTTNVLSTKIVDVVGGEKIAVSGQVYTSSGASGTVRIFARVTLANGNNTDISVSKVVTASSGTDEIVGVINVPANAVKVRMGLGPVSDFTTGQPTNWHSLSAKFQKPATLIENGAITTDKMTANSIKGDRIEAGSLDALKIVAGSIDSVQIKTNGIAAAKLVVSDFTNLVDDPIFTLGLGSANSGWVRRTGSTSASTIVTTTGLPGPSLKMDGVGTEVSVWQEPFQVQNNQKYFVEFRAQNNLTGTSTNARVRVYWYQSTMAAASTPFSEVVIPAGSWANFADPVANTFTAPANAKFGRVMIIHSNTSTGGSWWIGNLAIRRVSGGTLIENGAITTEKMTANTIKGDRIETNTLEGAKIIAGSIESAQIKAGSIFSDRLAVGNFDNLIEDPAMAVPLSSDVINSPWKAVTGTIAQWTYVTNASDPLKAIRGTTTSALGEQRLANRNRITVTTGDRYALSVRAISTIAGGTAELRLVWRQADGSIHSSFSIPIDGGATWTNYSKITPVAPSGATYAEFEFRIPATATGGAVQFGNILWQTAVGRTLIQDGAISTDQLAVGAITADKAIIANGAIKTLMVGLGQITTAQIGEVDAGLIKSGKILAARIDANSITADKILVGDVNNYIPDEGFASIAPDDLPLSDGVWFRRLGSSRSSVVSTNEGVAWKLDGGGETSVQTTNNARQRVKPGQKYTFTARIQNSLTGSQPGATFRIRWYRENGTALSTSEYTVAPTSGWVDFPSNLFPSMTFTAPSEAMYARYEMYQGAGATGGSWWINKPRLLAQVPNILIENGAITAEKITVTEEFTAAVITANSVKTDALFAGAITSKHTITGALFQTTESINRGIKIDAAGLTAYNASGVNTFNVSALTGNVNITGSFFSAPPGGGRLMIFNSTEFNAGAISFAAPDGERQGIIYSAPDSDLPGRNRININTFSYTGDTITNVTLGNYMMLRRNFGNFTGISTGIDMHQNHAEMYLCRPTTGGVSNAFIQRVRIGRNGDWQIGNSLSGQSCLYALEGTNSSVFLQRGDTHYVNLHSNGWTYFLANTGFSFDNRVILNGTNSYLSVGGNLTVGGAKNFIMPHPEKEGYTLKHASTEAPYNGVEYWSQETETIPASGELRVELPSYFESLTKTTGRAVLLSAGSANADLWNEKIVNGSFIVHGTPGAKFDWNVKAIRQIIEDNRDTLEFEVEYIKEEDDTEASATAPVPPAIEETSSPEEPTTSERE